MTPLWLLAATLACQAHDWVEQLECARLSYRANKEAFAFGTFRFQYTIGFAASASDAQSGVFVRSIKEDGFYVFDGKNARYELTADPKAVASVTTGIGARTSTSLARTFRMLTDGKVTFVDRLHLDSAGRDLLHQPHIFATTSYYHQHFEFPLYLGDQSDRPYDLFCDLTGVKEGRASLGELDLDSRLGDLKVCKLAFAWEDGRRTYWIDLNRGSVPLRILEHYNPTNVDINFFFSDLVQVPGAGWFPRRMVHIIGNGATVHRFDVTEIDARNRPTFAAFELDFPEPVGLYDEARKLAYSRRKTWSLLNLPSPSSREARPVVPTLIPGGELPGEIEAGPPWPTIVAAAIILFLTVGSVLIVRRRKNRLREP